MSGKNLTFKLIMEGDNKGLVASAKQSQEVVSKVFDTIKQEADALRATTDKASEGLKGLVTPETTRLAKALTDNLSNATSMIKGAGSQAQATAKNFTDFGKKSEQALGVLISDLSEAKKKLEAFSKTNASPAQIQAAQAQVDELEKQVTEAGAAFHEFNQTTSKANATLKNTDTAAQSAQKGLNNAKFAVNALVGAMATLGVGLGVRELAEAADSYTNLSARINIATKDGGNFIGAMAGVHQVALMTNSSLTATGDLFTRLNAVGKDMGMTQQNSLDLTKTINQAIQISGVSAQSAQAFTQQFIQSMQQGTLRGEEYNSMMENGYGVAEALARGLGVTTGELKRMADNGELSAARVYKALLSQKGEVESTFNSFPTTISNALQKISTSWEIMIGKMDQSNGASATVAEWLVTIADNIDVVETLLNDMGEGFVWVGDQLKKIDPATIEALKTALVTAYESIKELGSTLGNSFEITVDLLNTALSAVFNFDNSINEAKTNTNGFTKLLQALNVVLGFVGDGFNAIGIVANLLTGVFYDVAAAWQNFKSKFTWGDTKTEIIAEMNAMAEKAQEYYNKASNGAMDFKSKGIEAIQEISKTQQQKDAESVASSKAKLDALLAHQQTEANGKKVTEDEKLKAVQAYAEAAIVANKGAMDGVMQADLMTKGYIVTMDQAGKVSVEAWQKNTGAAKGTTNAADQARKAAAALGIDLDNALNRVSEKFSTTGTNLDDFALGMEDLGLKGEAATNALYTGWQKWTSEANNQAELDAAKAKLQEFGKTGQLSTQQVQMGLQEIERAALKLPAALSPAEAAMARLGIQSKEQLKIAAQDAMTDLETVMKSGEATQEGLQQAYERTIRLAQASGDAQTIAAANAKAAYLGLEVQIDSTGKATVAKLGEMQQAAVATQRTIQQVSNSSSNSKSEDVKNDDSDDYWDDFKKKMSDRVAKSNASAQARRSSNVSGVKAPIGTDSALASQSVIPDAPMIASSFDVTPIESTAPKQTVEIKIDMGIGQTATVSAAPDQADALKAMMLELEKIKRSS